MARERSASVRSSEGRLKMERKFVIGELSGPISALDQVYSGFGRGGETIQYCPESAANSIANNRIANLAADSEGHVVRTLVGVFHEDNSEVPTLSTARRCREFGKLPSGADPTGHEEAHTVNW